MRTRFDSELETLYVNMIKMGALSEDALNSLQIALGTNDRSIRSLCPQIWFNALSP